MTKNNILIIGSGAREHALGWKLQKSPKVGKIYFAPGSFGTEQIGESSGISMFDHDALIKFANNKKIDLTVAGPDDALASGIVNAFQKKGLKIFGPTQKASQVESSKAFAKKLMQEEKIPTAKYETFTDFEKAKKYISKQSLPIVIKASGLALGKGVIIAKTQEEAEKTLQDIMIKKVFGDAGNEVVIEEFLEGQEVSIHAFSDGENISLFPTSRDHKPIFEGNKGPNTGGMGTIAPLSEISQKQLEEIKNKIVLPAIKGLKKRGIPFVGCIYPGLMMTKDGPKVIEFNSRFGDPEMESYMRLLETDLFDILTACVDGKLNKVKINWSDKFACCIVLASAGYPASSHKGDIIHGLEKIKDKDIVVFHFATKKDGKNILTNGGRVLGITATGKTLSEALDKAYAVIGKNGIHFEGMQYRKDIGRTSVIASRAKQSTSKIKAIIFDMDGLIADTETIESKTLEILLKEYGKKAKPHANGLIHIVGGSGWGGGGEFKEKYFPNEDDQVLRKKKRAIFEGLLKTDLTPFPGFMPLLKHLKKNKYKIALASNRNVGHVNLIVELLGAKHFFDIIVGPDETIRHKPHPDIFLHVAKELKISPTECVVLEDSEIGVIAGHTAGMKVIAVPNKYTKDHNFSKADKIVESLEYVKMSLINL